MADEQVETATQVLDFKKPTLVEMLAEACNAVGGVEKKGKNKEQGYSYQRATDVAKAMRHEFFKRGIVIIPSEEAPEFIQVGETIKKSPIFECRLGINYRIMGHGSEITVRGYGAARDSSDKAIWKAKTGALKYFLRGVGLLPDEKDDPERDSPGFEEETSESQIEQEAGLLTIAGIITREDKYPEYIILRCHTLSNEGEVDVLLRATDGTNRNALTGKIGCLVSVKGKRLPASNVEMFAVMDVLSVRMPENESDASQAQPDTAKPTAAPRTPANGKSGGKPISEKQIARLFAIAKSVRMPADDVERLVHEKYKIGHVKDIPWTMYDDICKEVEALGLEV